MLSPFAVIQLPLAILTGVATIALYLTIFGDEPPETSAGVLSEAAAGPLFVFLVMTAIQTVFAQVAQGAGIVSIAGIATGRPVSLTAALDPAFTRMGVLIVLVLIVGAVFIGLFLTVFGIPFAIYFLLRSALSFPALMLEGLGPVAAIRRSWTLTQGNVLRLISVLLLSALVIMVPFMVLSALNELIVGDRTMRVVLTGVSAILQGVAAIPIAGFLTGATTVYYLTIRAARDERSTG